MTVEPYASARRVFWIVDNGSSHAGKTSIARMHAAHYNAELIHLPLHASCSTRLSCSSRSFSAKP
jgi:chloramphenicol 3-O-phosphotransferase